MYPIFAVQTIVFWNQSAERIFGYSADEARGRYCSEVDSDLDPLRFASGDQDVGALVEAMTTGQILEALNHIRNFRQKLDAQNKLQAVVTAVRLGILRWQ